MNSCIKPKHGICTLRAALQFTNSLPGSHSILLDNGQYNITLQGIDEDMSISGDLDVYGILNIIGQSEKGVIINGQAIDRVFHILKDGSAQNSVLSLKNLTVANGLAQSNHTDAVNHLGSGILVAPNQELRLENVTLKDHSDGSSILNQGMVLAHGVSFINNESNMNSAVAAAVTNWFDHDENDIIDAYMELSDCHFSNNLSNNASAITSSSFATFPQIAQPVVVKLDRCTFTNNIGNQPSVISNMFNTDMYISNTTISHNQSNANSGPVILNDGGSKIKISNSSILNNHGTVIDVHGGFGRIWSANSIIESDPNQNSALLLNSLGGNFFWRYSDINHIDLQKNDITQGDPLLDTITQLTIRQFAHVPLSGSPLLDTGVEIHCTSHDQINRFRPIDGNGDSKSKCDIGAIEQLRDLIFASDF
ncbi:choice-of-anchor Q domain-containing protein [Marinicella sp. W31]|uniref:choice-of-anchor Q domain-containing protein n=1 Tax=Marinicella sp. W31 TaxID=3023713 RepID=UPI0037565DEB